ncbi:hypothetical protein [Paraburkholderia sp. Ac-20340]|uniref:hypothetical protein n=1 Tax=Paraburkholderia sp. Ac-20340 TaxID=2703888 RepID=UPI001F1210B3|nr:hypothetical protein [Paraburkholderia sp. Ac-20340]
MEILEAYCVELGKVVDIYDAQKAYFALPENRRKRFTFRCSDDACRAEKNPLVSGVNYDKLVEDTEKFRQIHFRAPVGNPHLETCIWVQGHEQRQTGGGNADSDPHPRVARSKSTNVIDVFRPKTSDLSADGPSGRPVTNSPVDREPPDVNPSTGRGARTRDGYSSTSLLERFIDCWAQFEGDELKEHQVVIGGKTLSYRQAVLRPDWITPDENGRRIVCGGARVKFWPEDTPKRIYINFMDECEKFDESEGGRSLTIDLPLSRVHAYGGGALLMKKIEQAQAPGHYLKVYFWGKINARDQRPGYVVEIEALDNLVFKAIARQSDATAAAAPLDSRNG